MKRQEEEERLKMTKRDVMDEFQKYYNFKDFVSYRVREYIKLQHRYLKEKKLPKDYSDYNYDTPYYKVQIDALVEEEIAVTLIPFPRKSLTDYVELILPLDILTDDFSKVIDDWILKLEKKLNKE